VNHTRVTFCGWASYLTYYCRQERAATEVRPGTIYRIKSASARLFASVSSVSSYWHYYAFMKRYCLTTKRQSMMLCHCERRTCSRSPQSDLLRGRGRGYNTLRHKANAISSRQPWSLWI